MTKVLIVEDDKNIRTPFAYVLSRSGFKVIEAGDGGTAEALIERERPEVVILDMLMPGLSGLDFLKQTALRRRFPDTVVLAFSNIDTPRVVEEAKALGATEYLLKVNVTPRQMVEIIKRNLHQPEPIKA